MCGASLVVGHIDFRDACPRLSGCACPRLSNACPRLSECLSETFKCVPETFGCLPDTFECLPETFGCLISDLHCSVHSNAHSPTPRTRARSLSRSSRSLRLVGQAVRGIRGVAVAELELLAVPLFLSLFLCFLFLFSPARPPPLTPGAQHSPRDQKRSAHQYLNLWSIYISHWATILIRGIKNRE